MVATGRFRVLIPARSGSVGIRDKNVVDLGGHPLLAYSIRIALDLMPAERVWVSTDSKEYAQIAESYGATVPFIRPARMSRDSSTDLEVFQHAIEFEREQSAHTLTEYWIHLRPTSPFRDAEKIRLAMEKIKGAPGAQSLRSVEEISERPQKWMRIENGWLRTLTGEPSLDWSNRPRQLFETVYRPNGHVDVIRASTVGEGKLHGERSIGLITRPTVDIDSWADLKQARLMKNQILAFQDQYF